MATTVPQVLAPGQVKTAPARSVTRSRGPLYQAITRTLRNPMGLFGAVGGADPCPCRDLRAP